MVFFFLVQSDPKPELSSWFHSIVFNRSTTLWFLQSLYSRSEFVLSNFDHSISTNHFWESCWNLINFRLSMNLFQLKNHQVFVTIFFFLFLIVSDQYLIKYRTVNRKFSYLFGWMFRYRSSGRTRMDFYVNCSITNFSSFRCYHHGHSP